MGPGISLLLGNPAQLLLESFLPRFKPAPMSVRYGQSSPWRGRAHQKLQTPNNRATTYALSERPRNWRNMWKGDD